MRVVITQPNGPMPSLEELIKALQVVQEMADREGSKVETIEVIECKIEIEIDIADR